MCLLLLAYDTHPDYRLVVAENRDEFYERPTAAARFWDEQPDILAGRDLERGGTWFGVSLGGRWAAVTNYRDHRNRIYSRLSRGQLVRQYLESTEGSESFMRQLDDEAGHYAGYNLIGGDSTGCFYYSNTGGGKKELEPGIYGLSNHWLDTPWPKVRRAKSEFGRWVENGSSNPEELFTILANREQAADSELPDTGIGLEWERMLSARFIVGETYGTRATTVYMVDRSGHAAFIERSFIAGNSDGDERRFSLPAAD